MKNLTVLIFLLLTTFPMNAQMSDSRQNAYDFNVSNDNVALDGYDPVSYHTSEDPKKGRSDISTTRKGVIYYFSTKENLARFMGSPDKYEPAYGGWCAYAMGEDGSKVKIDPETYKIIDGKVYLFYHTFFVNTLPKWDKDESRLKDEADKNWEQIISGNQ